jgi:hypothetical protein
MISTFLYLHQNLSTTKHFLSTYPSNENIVIIVQNNHELSKLYPHLLVNSAHHFPFFFIIEDFYKHPLEEYPSVLLSLFVLQHSFHSIIYIPNSYYFYHPISIISILSSFEQNYTYFSIQSEWNSDISNIHENILQTFSILQKKYVTMKLIHQDFLSTNFYIFHSHLLSLFFSSLNLSSSNLSSFLSSYHLHPFLHYIYLLVSIQKINIYPLSKNIMIFQPLQSHIQTILSSFPSYPFPPLYLNSHTENSLP